MNTVLLDPLRLSGLGEPCGHSSCSCWCCLDLQYSSCSPVRHTVCFSYSICYKVEKIWMPFVWVLCNVEYSTVFFLPSKTTNRGHRVGQCVQKLPSAANCYLKKGITAEFQSHQVITVAGPGYFADTVILTHLILKIWMWQYSCFPCMRLLLQIHPWLCLFRETVMY